MTRIILALALLISIPALADDDELDSQATALEYPTLIKRAEKRDHGNLVCGVMIRCKTANEQECRVQYKSEKIDGIYSVAYAPGTSRVTRGKNGSLQVQGTLDGDTRAPSAGISAPTISYRWAIGGQLKYDEGKKLFSYTQKQKTASVKATFNGQSESAGSFSLKDIQHCSGMGQVAP